MAKTGCWLLAVTLSCELFFGGASRALGAIKLTSPAFGSGESIPSQYTCQGQDLSPPLSIEGVPTKAKSLVLVMDDPDAPMGTWQHWLVWNLPSDTTTIEAGAPLTQAEQGKTSFGHQHYGGPCPPMGTHRYYFRLFALDTTLSIPGDSKRSALDKAIKSHVIEQTEWMGRYKKH